MKNSTRYRKMLQASVAAVRPPFLRSPTYYSVLVCYQCSVSLQVTTYRTRLQYPFCPLLESYNVVSVRIEFNGQLELNIPKKLMHSIPLTSQKLTLLRKNSNLIGSLENQNLMEPLIKHQNPSKEEHNPRLTPTPRNGPSKGVRDTPMQRFSAHKHGHYSSSTFNKKATNSDSKHGS